MEIESNQLLPTDLVLEIVARSSTAVTIVRCAATSKPLRRGILHPAFLRRLRGVIPRNDDDDDDDDDNGHHSFIPSLLLGLFHQTHDPCCPPAFVPAAADASVPSSLTLVPTTPPNNDTNEKACVFRSYLPVASRRSLLVLRRRCKTSSQDRHHHAVHHGEHPVELSVCNPASDERWVLPPYEVYDETHVLLDVNRDAPPGTQSFKLLVAQLPESSPRTLIVQVFSSEERDWGPPLACTISRGCHFDGRPKPVVLRGAVHWLCGTYTAHSILKWERRGDGADPMVSLMKLPRSCESGVQDMCLVLAPSTDGTSQASLSVLVLEGDQIAVWVRRTSARGKGSWVQRHVIHEENIARPMDFPERWLSATALGWFCEGSGTLYLQGGEGAPLLLNLDGMAVNKVSWDLYPQPGFCLYEVDLLSYMLFVMKAF